MPKGDNYNRNLKKKFKCIICKCTFYNNPQAHPKYCGKCRKKAHNLKVKEWREKNKERHIINQRKWVEKNRERLRENIIRYEKMNREKRNEKERDYRKKYPEKIKAHNIANKLLLKKECEICGSTRKLERHHPDYSKPSEFVTLCKKCHSKKHRRYKFERQKRK